jgi:hypothetical protein
VLITIGSVTGVSIAALFTGGLLPGLVLAITLSALVWWRTGEDLAHVPRAAAGESPRAFFIALPAIALPFVIRYAVVEGIATRPGSLHHRHRLCLPSSATFIYGSDLTAIRLAADRANDGRDACLSGAIC